jgi:hypothetical protein
MPVCLTQKPELYGVQAAEVRCLLYTEHAQKAV